MRRFLILDKRKKRALHSLMSSHQGWFAGNQKMYSSDGGGCNMKHCTKERVASPCLVHEREAGGQGLARREEEKLCPNLSGGI